jgi:exodeoxyribonuclease X
MICVLDCETTGIDPRTDAVVEIASVYVSTPSTSSGGVIGEPRVSLVYPISADGSPRTIPAEASGIHHIVDEDVADAPLLFEALHLVITYPVDIFCAHNSPFDSSFLSMLSGRWIDTLRCARHLYPEAPNHKNMTLKYFLRLDMPRGGGAHRADADVLVTAHILARMMRERSVEELLELSVRPVLLRKMGFGKYRGLPFEELPSDYLGWMERTILSELGCDPDLAFTVKAELARRCGTWAEPQLCT